MFVLFVCFAFFGCSTAYEVPGPVTYAAAVAMSDPKIVCIFDFFLLPNL